MWRGTHIRLSGCLNRPGSQSAPPLLNQLFLDCRHRLWLTRWALHTLSNDMDSHPSTSTGDTPRSTSPSASKQSSPAREVLPVSESSPIVPPTSPASSREPSPQSESESDSQPPSYPGHSGTNPSRGGGTSLNASPSTREDDVDGTLFSFLEDRDNLLEVCQTSYRVWCITDSLWHRVYPFWIASILPILHIWPMRMRPKCVISDLRRLILLRDIMFSVWLRPSASN